MTERTTEDLLKQENPWDVSNIQEFLYYNCPECDTRVKDSELFVQHALENHELSKSYLNKVVLEVASNDQDNISDHEMVEVKERKPTKEELILSEKTFNELKVRKIKVEPDVLLEVQDQSMDYQDDAGSDFDEEYAEDEEDVQPE